MRVLYEMSDIILRQFGICEAALRFGQKISESTSVLGKWC